MPDLPEKTPALLSPVDTVHVPARPEPFAVRERFKKPSGIRLSTVWSEFQKRFFGKTEGPAGELGLQKYRLLKIAPDGPIIAELGGAARVETTVAAAFALMGRQPKGEPGFLQSDGYANIFYVRDVKGELCAVRVGWDEEGWVVDAISVDDPLAWNGKHQIFCPVPESEAP